LNEVPLKKISQNLKKSVLKEIYESHHYYYYLLIIMTRSSYNNNII